MCRAFIFGVFVSNIDFENYVEINGPGGGAPGTGGTVSGMITVEDSHGNTFTCATLVLAENATISSPGGGVVDVDIDAPQGPTGPTGPTGATGPQGPQGIPGPAPEGGVNGQVVQQVSGAPQWVSQPVDFETYSATVAAAQVLLSIYAQRTLTFAANCFAVNLDTALMTNFTANIVANGVVVGDVTVTAGQTNSPSVNTAFVLLAGQRLLVTATTVGAGVDCQGTATR